MAITTLLGTQSNGLLGLGGAGASGLLGGLGDLLDRVGDTVEDVLDPVGGTVDETVDTIADLLRAADPETGGLLGNLFENGLLGNTTGNLEQIVGIGLLGEDGVLTLDLAGTTIAVLPNNGGIVEVDANGLLGGNGNLTDLGGVLGEGGLLNLTGLVGENGILDLTGLLGSVLDLLGNGIDLDDFLDDDGNIDPSKFDQVMIGTDASDTFLVDTDSSTYVDGKGSVDTVNIASTSNDFAFAVGNDAAAFQSENAFIYLDNVERVKFFDAQLYLDTGAGENAGSAYRLYQAAFDRTPDDEGLQYWIGRLDAGVSLNAIADSFIHSPEFARTYGTLNSVSNSAYVDLLYDNILGRDYDTEGFNYWVSRLDNNQTNRGDLLAFFSESDENQALVATQIEDGIWLS